MKTKISKRVLAVALTVVMLLSVAPLGGFAGLDLFDVTASAANYVFDSFYKDSIAQADRFIVPVSVKTTVPEGYIGIYTAEDFYNIRKNTSGQYILMNNIDLSQYRNWSSITINGLVLEGNGYVVSNLTSTQSGLFNKARGTCRISNLGLENVSINTNSEKIGGFIGGDYGGYSASFSFSNCYISGNVSGTNGVGGFLGKAETTVTMNNCYNLANVSGKSGVGGLVGTNSAYQFVTVTIHSSLNKGDVSGTNRVGGIAGFLSGTGDQTKTTIKQCCNYGRIIGLSENSSCLGGICGGQSLVYGVINIIDCYNAQIISGYNGVGGICGESGAKIDTSYNMGKIYGTNQIDALVGIPFVKNSFWETTRRSTVKDSFYLNNMSSSHGKALSYLTMRKSFPFKNFDFNGIWNISTEINNGFPYLRSMERISWLLNDELYFSNDASNEVEVFPENEYIANIWLNLRGGETTPESETINMFLNFENMSSTIYNEMKKRKDFRVADIYWETLKTIFEPDSQAKRITIENFELYEALILDLIKRTMEDKDSQTGNIILDAVTVTGDILNSATPYKNIVSALSSSVEDYKIFDKLKEVRFDITSSGYQKIINDVKESSKISATTKTTLGKIFSDTDFMGACSMIFDVTSSAAGFYQKLTEYMIAKDMQKEMVTLLTEMKSKTSNEYFKFALQNVINSYKNTDYAAVICTLGLGADITFSFMSTIFDSVAMAIPFYREMKTVYGLGKMFINFTLNTEGIMDSFHSCGAMNNFINANKATIASLANKYKSSGSETDAGAYVYAMKTFEHVYVMDLEVAEKYYKDAEVYGLLNTVRNLKEQAINGVTNWLLGTDNKTDYEMFSESKTHIIQLTNTNFHDLLNSWIFDERYLKTDYPDIYPIYVSKELSQSSYSPNMHAYITEEGETRIDWSIPTFVITDIGSSNVLYGSNVLEGITYTEKVGSRSQSYEKAVRTVMQYDDNALIFNNSTDFETFNKYYTLKAYANTASGKVYTPTASAEISNPITKPVLTINKLVRPSDRINKISFEIEDYSLQLYSDIKYKVYRREGSSAWTTLKTITRSPNPFRTTTTVFTDDTAQIGKTYSYKVVSSYTFGNGKTLSSPESEVLTTRIGEPITPLNTQVREYEALKPKAKAAKSMAKAASTASTDPYIEVSWDLTSGATGYEVYRLASYANSYVLVATVDGDTSSYNDYDINSGVSYDYFVVPVISENGNDVYEMGTYNHAEIDFDVDLESIKITNYPSNTTYTYKKDCSTNGMRVVAKYSNGREKDVTNEVNVRDFGTGEKGDHTAIVEFEGKTATFNYSVKYTWWQWIIKIILFGWIWY